MLEPWLNFIIVTVVQLILFLTSAYHEKRFSDVSRILGYGILTGIVFGISFDFIFGKFFGFHSYVLEFDVFFLLVNVALSYGLFVANVLLLQKVKLAHFYIWTVVIVAVYEITNYIFPVWVWKLGLSPVAFLIALSVGYFGGAIFIATVWHVFFRYRFHFIDKILKQ